MSDRMNVVKQSLENLAIVAVDPGGTTGWATFTGPYGISSGQCSPEEFLDRCFNFVEAASFLDVDCVIVCEKYTITPETLRKTRQYDALYVIGALQFIARKFNAKFVLQTPAEAKGFTPNARLLDLELYNRGKDHANDALRHLLLWLGKAGHLVKPGMFLVQSGSGEST